MNLGLLYNQNVSRENIWSNDSLSLRRQCRPSTTETIAGLGNPNDDSQEVKYAPLSRIAIISPAETFGITLFLYTTSAEKAARSCNRHFLSSFSPDLIA